MTDEELFAYFKSEVRKAVEISPMRPAEMVLVLNAVASEIVAEILEAQKAESQAQCRAEELDV